MRHGILALLAASALVYGGDAAASPARKPLCVKERQAVLALFKAVDLVQETEVVSDAGAARPPETIAISAREMPFGIASRSIRPATAGAAAASGALTLREREAERQWRAAEEARKKEETRQRDPYVFPFEEYSSST